ncbi:thioredoxin, partial [Tepidiforma sp.]|uniref:thioredoxin n=1 Tax=Tepidiforma sp. TaxID=2682230 RepID=UPI002ADE77FD
MPAATATDVTDATFASEVLERSKTIPVVVDFWAPWCGPCRMLGPVIEKVAAENEGRVVLAKLNTDENPRTAMQYRIQGIPAVKAFKDGRVIAEFTGAYPEPQVRAFFQKVIASAGPAAPSPAEELLRKGDVAGAEREYRATLQKSPNDPDAVLGLASILIARGERDEATRLLDRLPTDRRARALKHRLFLDEFRQKHAAEDLEGEARRNPRDPRARYRWGVMLAAQERYTDALDELLESVRIDRAFADGAARKAMLAV